MIGIVGLCEAGNFGDDLIVVAAVQAIMDASPGADVVFTGFGNPLDWDLLSRQLGTSLRPRSRSTGKDLPGSRRAQTLLADCDGIVFGGGGLLQTTHHRNRPYHWLRYLPRTDPVVPVLAVGLGLGPLSKVWGARLRRMGSPFEDCYVRDEQSLELARNGLGWSADRCRDFVDLPFLDRLGILGNQAEKAETRLGVAVRVWPGLDADALAAHIDSVAASWAVDSVRLYVLEARHDGGPDAHFARSVASKLTIGRISERCYRPDEMVDFAQDMAGCTVAVSMKLHADALWAAAGVPMFPIIYAPKTAALFGRPYGGLEVVQEVVAVPPEPEDIPRAHDVVSRWLERALAHPAHVLPSRLGELSRRRYQGMNVVMAGKGRLAKAWTRLQGSRPGCASRAVPRRPDLSRHGSRVPGTRGQR